VFSLTAVFTRIFLPFAFCYFLSYMFRTINGPLADELVRHFSLSGGSLGIITSTYFLAFALSAIPIGVALDAFRPRLVQGWLMTVAAIGASVFALASSPLLLILGRFLIGIGVAGGLMAGLKAHALWLSPGRVPLANGALVMFGGLGAIATTLPIEPTERTLGWRGIFVALALISMVIAALIFALVPRSVATDPEQRRAGAPNGLIGAIRDPCFVRIAPLSASVVGTAFAVHGFWAARWLADVEGLPPAEVLHGLFAMGVGLTFGALLIGLADTWLSRIGASQVRIFGRFCLAFIALQALVLAHVGLPVSLLWGLIGGFGGMCVLSYSILDSMFSPALVGRANSALNVFHLTTAWVM
jgi:predicted MFS family arabinose efflux permease